MRKASNRPRKGKPLAAHQRNELFLPAHVAMSLLHTDHFRADQAGELAFFLDLANVCATDRRNAGVCRSASAAMDTLIRLRDHGVATGEWAVAEADRDHLLDAIVTCDNYLRSLSHVGLTRGLHNLLAWCNSSGG